MSPSTGNSFALIWGCVGQSLTSLPWDVHLYTAQSNVYKFFASVTTYSFHENVMKAVINFCYTNFIYLLFLSAFLLTGIVLAATDDDGVYNAIIYHFSHDCERN